MSHLLFVRRTHCTLTPEVFYFITNWLVTRLPMETYSEPLCVWTYRNSSQYPFLYFIFYSPVSPPYFQFFSCSHHHLCVCVFCVCALRVVLPLCKHKKKKLRENLLRTKHIEINKSDINQYAIAFVRFRINCYLRFSNDTQKKHRKEEKKNYRETFNKIDV